MLKKIGLLTVFAGLLFSCGKNGFDREDGLQSVTAKDLEQHIKALSSDEFQGRRPFTPGEKKTLNYLETQFKELGLEPGNGTSFLQEVPMVEITPTADSIMMVKGHGKNFKLSGFKDYVLWTQRNDSSVVLKDEELVFAGFGIVAPEYHWNDYEGLDVKNKIVMVLVNDPGFGGSDSSFFKGNAMTYYGRWTYKFEEAARQGAKGCLVIHNTIPAAYGFGVVQNSWNSPHFYLDQREKKVTTCSAIGWTSLPATEKLFEAAGLNLNELQSKARQPGFRGMSLNLKISTSLKTKITFDKSYNAICKITGSERPDEYIIYSAHWDHLGIDKKDSAGDSIYNGAHDNASGTAGLIMLAKAFKSMKNKPKRTIVFLAVTAEEQGLLGSAYYSQNPIYPVAKTVANINIDGMNPYGRMKDIIIVGKGQSDLEDYLSAAALAAGRYVVPDNEAEKGYYFRSDHFNFAKVGIPALYTSIGSDFTDKGKEYGQQLKDSYREKHYHQPSDEYDSTSWNLDGAVDDAKLLFQVGKRLAFEDSWPQWKADSEFKALRDSAKK